MATIAPPSGVGVAATPPAEKTSPASPQREDRSADAQRTVANAPVPTHSPEGLEEVVERLQERLEATAPPNWGVNIHEDEETGTVVIEIKDEDGEVIKQFPPEKVLNLARKMDELVGMVVDATS